MTEFTVFTTIPFPAFLSVFLVLEEAGIMYHMVSLQANHQQLIWLQHWIQVSALKKMLVPESTADSPITLFPLMCSTSFTKRSNILLLCVHVCETYFKANDIPITTPFESSRKSLIL